MSQNQTPIKATTQDHLNIEDIQDDLVILKDGSVCLVMQTSAVNFGLLSEAEQDATIYAYAGLLNSLTFPIQILIRSQRKDVTSYLKLLKNEEEKQKNSLLKERITKYRFFVESTVRENNVLDKKFYIIIPFSSLELGIKGAGGMFKKGLPYPKSYILEKAKVSLNPKRDHLSRQFNRIGLKIEQLKTKALIEMFFRIYNPESVGNQPTGEPGDYEKPLVEAAIEGKTNSFPEAAKSNSAPLPPLLETPIIDPVPKSSLPTDIFSPKTPLNSNPPPPVFVPKTNPPAGNFPPPASPKVMPSSPVASEMPKKNITEHPIWKSEEIKLPSNTNEENHTASTNQSNPIKPTNPIPKPNDQL